MMTFATIMLAALSSASLQRSSAEALVQEENKRTQLMRSQLATLSEEEKGKIVREHQRVGRELKEMLGFAVGQAFTNYDFRAVGTNASPTVRSRFVLPASALGFPEFRPLVTEGTVWGVCLLRPFEGEFAEADRRTVQGETRTNLCARLGLEPEDVRVSTNGVRHAWRFSFEHWNEALVLRISDEEQWAALLRAADERRRSAREVKKETEMVK